MIHYLKGDATKPVNPLKVLEGPDKGLEFGAMAILHICNDVGVWGAGFVKALSKRWKEPERYYRRHKKHILGDVQFVWVEPTIVVINMIAQHGIVRGPVPPIRYDALEECLKEVHDWIYSQNQVITIHMPRIGCGLAGGTWDKVEPIIQRTIGQYDVYVYDLEEKT